MIQRVNEDSIFHVHTVRCKHAFDSDEDFVKTAIKLGAKKIIFTDHVPYPGDTLPNRMDMSELPDYIASITELRKRYEGTIGVEMGLEIEYMPSYKTYYEELCAMPELEWLIVGQHFYEHKDGTVSYYDSKETKKKFEYKGQFEAMLKAAETGMFRVIAHPDRSFRAMTEWTEEMAALSSDLITIALEKDIILEQNLSSMEMPGYYWKELWQQAERMSNEAGRILRITYGYDAHAKEELEERYELKQRLIQI